MLESFKDKAAEGFCSTDANPALPINKLLVMLSKRMLIKQNFTLLFC